MPLGSRIMVMVLGTGILFAVSNIGLIAFNAQQNELRTLGKAVAVPAEVVSTGIEETESHTENSSGPLYQGVVTYKYNYQGTDYQSSRRDLSNTSTGIRNLAENDIAPFSPGKKITAWVSTEDPAVATLSRSVSIATYFVLLFLSIFGLIGGGLMMLGFVGVSPGQRATPAQEIFYDLPFAFWILIIGAQLVSYFSNASAPYSLGAYVYIIIYIALSALLVRFRLIARGLAPAFGGGRANFSHSGEATVFDSNKKAASRSRNPGFEAQGFASGQIGKNYFQPVQAVGPNGSTITFSPGQVKLFKGINLVILLVVAGIFATKFIGLQNAAVEAQSNINPERRDVKSKEQAVADIKKYDEMVRKQGDATAYKWRGISYFGAEQYDKAIADLTTAADKSAPPDQQTLIFRCHAYILTSQWAKGLAAHQAYLKLYNSSWDRWFAHRGMGICQYHLKQYQAAANSFTEALKEDADMEYLEKQELLYDRAMANQHLGKSELAANDRKQISAKNTKWWLK